jgi:uncharacterized repeat protein (TIGR01451 family)
VARISRFHHTLAAIFGACSALLLLTIAGTAWAGINGWSYTGPDGGFVNGVAWHPARDGVVFAAAGRVFRSTNSGTSWTAVSATAPIYGQFVFDPANPDRILVAGQPVMRSLDGGASFTAATELPDRDAVSKLVMSADGSTIFAASHGKVYRTTDFAQSWVEISTGLPGGLGNFATGLLISPADPNTLYVSFSVDGLFRSTNGGASWSPVTTITGYIHQIAINPNNAQQLLAATTGNASLLRTNDAGATWSTMANGYFMWVGYDPLVVNRAMAIDTNTKRLIVSTDGGGAWVPAASIPSAQANTAAFSATTAGTLAIGTTEGVYYSSDTGQSISFRSTGLNGADVRTIAASRTSPFRVYASFYGGPDGVHRRASGAWEPASVGQFYAAMGFRTVVPGLAVDPNDSSVVYAAGFAALLKSTDAGNSWTSLASASFGAYPPDAIAIDRTNTQVLTVASQTAGILRSVDGGATWVPRNTGLPVEGVSVRTINIFVDPANSQRLYTLLLPSSTLYQSMDAGLNWAQAGSGSPGGSTGVPANEYVYCVAFDPLDSNRVYLGAGAGVYRSLDGGNTWALMTVPLGTLAVRSILIDPVAPGTVVVVSSGTQGLVRTVDYGSTWERIPWDTQNDGILPPMMGVMDAAQPGNLIVGAMQRGIREYQIAPDLSVAMSGVASRIPLGATPTLQLNVQNKLNSLHAASDATVTMTLPAALVPGTISTSRGSCVRAGQSFTCRLGALKVGETAQISLPLTVALGTGTVTASVAAREAELTSTDNMAVATVSVEPFADLRATLAVPAMVDHRGSPTLTAEMVNLGPNGALNSTLVFTLPSGLSAVNGGHCAVAGSTATCSIGSLPMGGSATVELAVTATTIGPQDVTVAATASSFDPDMSNNLAGATVTVRPVTDLAVALSNATSPVVSGQIGTAAVTLTNQGSDAVGIAVATISGTNLTVTSASPSVGTCAISGGSASCSFGALAAGASNTVNVSFSPVAPGAAVLSVSTNSEATDTAAGNNTASQAIAVTPVADFSVTLMSSPAALNRLSTTTVTARVTNGGPHSAPTARLVLNIPLGLSVTAATTSRGTCAISSTTVDCALGSMNSGDVATIDVTANGVAVGSALVNAAVTTSAFDPATSNNAVSTSTVVRGLTDLTISMSALPATLQTGQTATTTITVVNNGPDDAGIVVANLVPNNLEVQSATPVSGSCSITTASTDCSLGALPSGASRTIAVNVAMRAVGTATLTATTNFEGGERSSTDNAASGSTSVTAPSGGGGGSGGGSGGGGALEFWTLLALMAGAWERVRVRRVARVGRSRTRK